MRHFSNGAFFEVTDFHPEQWRKRLDFIDSLASVDHVEVWLEHVPRTAREQQVLGQVLEGRTTVVHAPFIGLSLVLPWREVVDASFDRIARGLECAARLGAAVYTVHLGTGPVYEDRRALMDRAVRQLARLITVDGPRIAVENMPDRRAAGIECLSSLASLLELWMQLPEVGLTVDLGHAIQNGEDPIPFVERNCDKIANLHLHDALAGAAGHLALGQGELDVAALARVLHASGYPGFVGIETLGPVDTSASWSVWLEAIGHGSIFEVA